MTTATATNRTATNRTATNENALGRRQIPLSAQRLMGRRLTLTVVFRRVVVGTPACGQKDAHIRTAVIRPSLYNDPQRVPGLAPAVWVRAWMSAVCAAGCQRSRGSCQRVGRIQTRSRQHRGGHGDHARTAVIRPSLYSRRSLLQQSTTGNVGSRRRRSARSELITVAL